MVADLLETSDIERPSYINPTNGLISETEWPSATRAIKRQIREDFAPHWNFGDCLQGYRAIFQM